MKTTDVNPLRWHFFCRRKTNIGRHLRRHCRMPSRIPMAGLNTEQPVRGRRQLVFVTLNGKLAINSGPLPPPPS